MAQLLLHNARLIFGDGIQRGGVVVRDGRIAQVFTNDQTPAGFSAADAIDLQGRQLAPGMIDIHIHGSAGVDVQAASGDELQSLSDFLLGEGVTGYLATFVPTDERGYREAIAAVESFIAAQRESEARGQARGARVLGIHFEGPFVSRNRCGALKTEHFRTYDGDPRSIQVFTGSTESNPAYTRLMTLAPEIAGGLELIRALTAAGVRPLIGHTEADPETLDAAFAAGARHITHFPNALAPLHHRKPGAIAWGLLRDDVTLDCIADLHHVHPLMLRLMAKAKTASRMALISDAIQPAGLGDGTFNVWDIEIAVKDGLTALVNGPGAGTIAGSVITMREALRNITRTGVALNDAARMASAVPARAAGLDHDYGLIEAGKRADLIAFDDDFNVQAAVVGGAVAFINS
ncbi:MAG TPA: N-acetylglucosamine-6-phosphate deacetylase [Blastocatellia bacterium]|nr:N-acetylglucosamine-6-phosphate deacetylase [Blastocatellia bacterium]